MLWYHLKFIPETDHTGKRYPSLLYNIARKITKSETDPEMRVF